MILDSDNARALARVAASGIGAYLEIVTRAVSPEAASRMRRWREAATEVTTDDEHLVAGLAIAGCMTDADYFAVTEAFAGLIDDLKKVQTVRKSGEREWN